MNEKTSITSVQKSPMLTALIQDQGKAIDGLYETVLKLYDLLKPVMNVQGDADATGSEKAPEFPVPLGRDIVMQMHTIATCQDTVLAIIRRLEI
jgi:hypothetical protein